MQQIYRALGWLLFLSIHTLTAQQSYFNVPSSDRTPQGTFFFQEQVNHDFNEFTFNSTFDWGITKNWECGFNLIQFNYDFNGGGLRKSLDHPSAQTPLFPILTFNTQYFLPLNEHHQVSIGAVWGFSPLQSLHWKDQAGFFFLNDKFTPVEGVKITAGIISGNTHFAGPGVWMDGSTSNLALGYQIGTEINLYHEKLMFIGDHISGANSLGVSTAGLAVKIPHHWILSLGGFFANPHSGNPNGIVMEFTRAL